MEYVSLLTESCSYFTALNIGRASFRDLSQSKTVLFRRYLTKQLVTVRDTWFIAGKDGILSPKGRCANTSCCFACFAYDNTLINSFSHEFDKGYRYAGPHKHTLKVLVGRAMHMTLCFFFHTIASVRDLQVWRRSVATWTPSSVILKHTKNGER